MGCSDHKYNLIFIVYFEKKAPRTNAIPPCLRLKAFKLFDVLSEMGMYPQLWIDIILQLFADTVLPGSCDPD